MSIRLTRPVVALVAVAVALALVVPFVGNDRAGAADSTITVVHGIPDVPVDVYVAGALTVPGFQPLTTAGPLTLPAGDYDVQLYPAIASPPAAQSDRGDSAIHGETLTVPSGVNATVVAQIISGAPGFSLFANDTSAVPEGSARVTVRHTAQAPTVDVAVDGTVALPGLAAGAEAAAVLPAGTYTFEVLAGGSPVLTLADTAIPAGKNVIVYAVGSATADPASLTTVVQVLDVAQTPGAGTPAPAVPAAAAHTAPAFTG